MPKKPEKPAALSQQEWDDMDIPERTATDFATAVPFKNAHPEQFQAWRRGRGRPKAARPRVHMGFRFAADVAEAIRATGKGYGARVERVLREALAKGRL